MTPAPAPARDPASPDLPTDLTGVIESLTEIIDDARRRPSRLGYFPALYRKVTVRVRTRVEQGGFFDDDARMARLAVTFANRYLEAVAQWKSQTPPTRCWKFAFTVTDQWWPIVLQHLLLGMNAHINLDLGIAAAESVPRERLPALRSDFEKINQLLFELVSDVQRELTWIWPPLRWITRFLGGVERTLIQFSMSEARDSAWSFAEQLAPLDGQARASAIEQRDEEMLELSRLVRRPGILLGIVTRVVRLGERGGVRRIIGVLE